MIQVAKKKKSPERHETGVRWRSGAGKESLAGDREQIQREYWTSKQMLDVWCSSKMWPPSTSPGRPTQVTSTLRSLNGGFEWLIHSLLTQAPKLMANSPEVSAIHIFLSGIRAVFLLSLILFHLSYSDCLTQEIGPEGTQSQSTRQTQLTATFHLHTWYLNFLISWNILKYEDRIVKSKFGLSFSGLRLWGRRSVQIIMC